MHCRDTHREALVRIQWVLLGLVALTACGRGDDRQLIIFNAAALAPPFKVLGDSLAGADGRIVQENSPSLEAVRKLTALGKTPDILAVADVSLLDSLVVPRYSSWYLIFGTNALVLAFSPTSKLGNSLTVRNWPDVLLQPGVRVGRADPKVDPSGYRTLMALQLAERYYQRPGLAAQLLAAMPARYVRHAEADLSALAETGDLDVIWTYRNLAQAHGLGWLDLPPEVNLEHPEFSSLYGQVSVTLPGTGGDSLRVVGAPITFALTIPRDAASPDLAARFVLALLGPVGREAFKATGFSMLPVPNFVGDSIPSSLASAALLSR